MNEIADAIAVVALEFGAKQQVLAAVCGADGFSFLGLVREISFRHFHFWGNKSVSIIILFVFTIVKYNVCSLYTFYQSYRS